MAYSTLLSLEKAINQTLDSDQLSISPHEKTLIVSLDKRVISFQTFLEDFPHKAKNLEARIRDVAAKAEDIIERFLIKKFRHRNTRRFALQRETSIQRGISVLRRFMFKYQLQKVRDEMDLITTKVVESQNSIIIEDIQLDDSMGASSSSQVANAQKINMDDFNKDLERKRNELCKGTQELQILSIFGMGGIGKTTLARNAYDDQSVVEHFAIRVWVTVSGDYSQQRMLMNLLDSMKVFDLEPMAGNSEQGNESQVKTPKLSNSEMELKVYQILISRRFLIVMDDIWSTKVLDDVRNLFPNSNNGSRIMLTTRLTEVARYANSSILPHEMRLMDADQSWNLLCQKVFVHQDRVPCELEIIGREIARSCGGLPLVIVVIAGLLSTTSKTLNSWKEVARNIRSSLASADGRIEKILSLSYNHLPHHLRPCFLYMGGFPEDHRIKVTDLIRLWIAESFVEQVESKEFEDTAEKYVEDLLDRNLIQITRSKSNDKIQSCSLHDMVREMCIKLSYDEKFLVHIKSRQALKLLKRMKDQRRVSIFHSDVNSFSNIYSSTIRTIIYFQDELGSFGSFRLLRVLDVIRVDFRSYLIPYQFFELFHLRYLAFSYHGQIPSAISNLQSLQTLIIKEQFSSYSFLPNEIWNMPQLRHLIFSKKGLRNNYVATSAIENLQTLWKIHNLECSIATLKLIPNLRKLWLTYSKGSFELLFDNLVQLHRLEKLRLELRGAWKDSGNPNLVVPKSLTKLTLTGWGKKETYLGIVGPFLNLEVLKLKKFNFTSQVWETNDEDFPQLKFLLIEESNIRQWVTESSHFPRLKALHIHSCMELSDIPECMGNIPTLEFIEIKLCTKSLAVSAKKMQEEAADCGNDAFRVRCIDCTRKLSETRVEERQ